MRKTFDSPHVKMPQKGGVYIRNGRRYLIKN